MSATAAADRPRLPARRADDAATLPVPERVNRATPMPREELRSARYAHPQERRRDESAVMPRPGVSYISPAARSEPSLPRVAPIRRADADGQAMPERRARMPESVDNPPRVRAEPRVERAQMSRPNFQREQPREVARPTFNREPPRETARPAFTREPPRPQPMQRQAPPSAPTPRYTPLPRREAPPPARADAQRLRQADPRKDHER